MDVMWGEDDVTSSGPTKMGYRGPPHEAARAAHPGGKIFAKMKTPSDACSPSWASLPSSEG